jgi:hypothetical protein
VAWHYTMQVAKKSFPPCFPIPPATTTRYGWGTTTSIYALGTGAPIFFCLCLHPSE